MTAIPRSSRAVDGKGRTIREVLAGYKYSIDYYQRECDARQELYQRLEEQIWSPERLAHELLS
jgi:hypothetical protein